MLRSDAAKLRWLGMDMRPRWRRRMAVVVSYAVYLALVWFHPWWVMKLFIVLFVGWMARIFDVQLKEDLNPVARRIVVGGIALVYLLSLWKNSLLANRAAIDMWSFGWIVGWSALSYGRLVEGVWMRRWTKRWLEKPSRLVSLDDFALHFYGERFEELTGEKRTEVFRIERSNPIGTWVKRGDGLSPTIQDERLRHEDDRLRAEVQRAMTWVLVGSAVVWSFAGTSVWRSVRGDAFAAWAWMIAALSVTLRQAIVLWSEEDLSEMSGEIRLAERGLSDVAR
jgi:hypothetical protein